MGVRTDMLRVGAPTDTRVRRRDFVVAATIGCVAAAIPFVWMLAIGRLDFVQREGFGGFYDVQAHRLLSGAWDVPRSALGFEAFIVDGKAYMYFGPFPALLRMPIAALTDRFDGRLTQLSILAAFVLLMAATTRLLWRVRALARPNAPVGSLERWATGVFLLVVGTGSVVLFLASRPVVYHEAELWGAALSIAAFVAILGYIVGPNRRDLAWAAVCIALALLTRGSVALAPFSALVIVLVGRALATFASTTRRAAWLRPVAALGLPQSKASRAQLAGLALAVLVPFGMYAFVNEAKFGHPWKLPIADQIATQIDPVRPRIFAETNGSLFAPEFVPTDVLAAFRPDGIAFERVFPFVTFPEPASIVGDVMFAARDPQASLPASMPFLFVLAVVGVVAVFWRARTGASFAPLRALVIGGVVGAAGVLTIPFVNHRYLADVLPLMVVGAAAGIELLLRRFDTADTIRTARGRAAIVLIAALGLASVFANFALALQYQRAYSPFTSAGERAAYVRFQQAIDRRLPGPFRFDVTRGDRLPKTGAGGTLFVVGRCAGVYWSDGRMWHPIERTPATGRYALRTTFPARPAGTRESLLVAGPDRSPDRLEVVWLDDGRVEFALRGFESPPQRLPAGSPVDLEIVYDRSLPQAEVFVDGRSVFGAPAPLPSGPVDVAGRPGSRATFSGEVEPLPTRTPLCDDLSG